MAGNDVPLPARRAPSPPPAPRAARLDACSREDACRRTPRCPHFGSCRLADVLDAKTDGRRL